MKNKVLLGITVLTLVVTPLLLPQQADAATTLTKYLNGKIGFESYHEGNSELYTMNRNNNSVTRLTNNSAGEGNLAWSNAGDKVTFTSNHDGNYEIYTMNSDGSNVTRLTNNPAGDYYPSWSPDGSKLTFESSRNGTSEIYSMNADGSNATRLTNNSVHDFGAAWSPDGNKLVFYSIRDGNAEIYTMNPDGSNATRLTNNPAGNWNPGWSPDGASIVFSSFRDGNAETYTMAADGSNVMRITNTPTDNEDSATYSPDGFNFIVNVYDTGYVVSDIFFMDLDGSNRTQLTNFGGNKTAYSSRPWQLLPYTQTTNDDSSITSTISADKNYDATDYAVIANETLVLDGSLRNVTVQSGGKLSGDGTAGSIIVNSGGFLAPGQSPGCLASGNLSLAGTYTAEVGGTTSCSGYDQMQVTGTVDLMGSSLSTSLVNNFVPSNGNTFTIITNDGSDPITGTFAGLAQGASFTAGGVTYQISYIGSDGNDVVLTVTAITPGTPNTGFQLLYAKPWVTIIFAFLTFSGLMYLARISKFKGTAR